MMLTRTLLLCSLMLPIFGCSSADAPTNFATAQTLSFQSYEHLYYGHTYTCIWYTGSDANFNYYAMEHWSLNADKTDGQLLGRDLYKVAVGDININSPMDLTTDHDKWVLIWPTKLEDVQ